MEQCGAVDLTEKSSYGHNAFMSILHLLDDSGEYVGGVEGHVQVLCHRNKGLKYLHFLFHL